MVHFVWILLCFRLLLRSHYRESGCHVFTTTHTEPEFGKSCSCPAGLHTTSVTTIIIEASDYVLMRRRSAQVDRGEWCGQRSAYYFHRPLLFPLQHTKAFTSKNMTCLISLINVTEVIDAHINTLAYTGMKR